MKLKNEPSVDPASLYLLDIPTAARLLSTNVWALRKLLQVGEITYINIGHKFLISHDAIRAFIRRREAHDSSQLAVVREPASLRAG